MSRGLNNINRYFDYLLKNNLNSIESSSSKDMIFEVLKARFDILNKYRKSIKNLAKYIKSNPHKFIIITCCNSCILSRSIYTRYAVD